MLRQALLILDLQNEFLAPSGRCRVSNYPAAAEKDPSFIDNILSFVTAFRQAGSGDIIWVRSEFSKPRDANDEKVLLYEEGSEDGQETPEGRGGGGGGGQKGDRIGKFDEFLSSTVDPYCEKGSPAADFHESVIEATKAPKDRIIRKTWYSAFIKTGLVEILRGRLATELFICGLKTNISVFATVSDAVRHGFQVTVLDDCIGFSDRRLHDIALSQMAGVLGCEVTRSAGIVGEWIAKTKPARSMPTAQTTATTKEDLTKMIEKLSLGEDKDAKISKRQLEEEEEALEQEQQQQQEEQQPTQQSGGLDADLTLHHGQKEVNTRRQSEEESKPLCKIKGTPALLREGDKMGEGDTRLVNGILPPDLENVAFERLRQEVRWRTMLHRGGEVPRLVAVEGDIGEDGRQVGALPLFPPPLFIHALTMSPSLPPHFIYLLQSQFSFANSVPECSAFPFTAILQMSLHRFVPFLLQYPSSATMSKRLSITLSTMCLFNTIAVVMTTSLSIRTRPWISFQALLSLMSVLVRNEQ